MAELVSTEVSSYRNRTYLILGATIFVAGIGLGILGCTYLIPLTGELVLPRVPFRPLPLEDLVAPLDIDEIVRSPLVVVHQSMSEFSTDVDR